VTERWRGKLRGGTERKSATAIPITLPSPTRSPDEKVKEQLVRLSPCFLLGHPREYGDDDEQSIQRVVKFFKNRFGPSAEFQDWLVSWFFF